MIEASPELRRLLGGDQADTADGSRIVFEGRRFSISFDQLERWRKQFPQANHMQELQIADDYYWEHPADDGKYLARVARWLQRAQEAGAERQSQLDRERGRSW